MAQKNAGKFSRFLSLIVKNWQASVFCVFALMVLVELIEQILLLLFGEPAHILYDLFVLLGVVPFGAWLLLRFLKQMDLEREQAQVSTDMYMEFSQRLGEARSWDDLIKEMISFPHRVAPKAQVTLFSINPVDQNLQPEAVCDRKGNITFKPAIAPNGDSLPVGSLQQLLVQEHSTTSPAREALVEAFRARLENSAPQPTSPSRYDLPITHNGAQIGVIKLEFLPGDAPSKNQIHSLRAAAPVMGLALEGALLQKLAAEQAAASQTQRQEIAQTLHDTLAQNVGYLRLKLDQLTGEKAILEIGAVLQELERMRSTADEAYQQVRNTLDELNLAQPVNLVSTLFKQARTISTRAGFSLRTSQVGKQRNLPVPIREHTLYIVREALYNVEKHARASQVHLQFIWLESELIIKITDDGVGFNPRVVPAEGHYGLWIMQQRAQEIGGTLKISPAADMNGDAPGTEVTLWVPCPVTKVPLVNFAGASAARQDPGNGSQAKNAQVAD